MEELKPHESEALDIVESLLDIADMKNTGPLYADNPPRSGMCRIPEDDAEKLRQYIADRRAAPENKPLTLEQLRKMDGEPVWIMEKHSQRNGWYLRFGTNERMNSEVFTPCSGLSQGFQSPKYGKTWLAYARKPEGRGKP